MNKATVKKLTVRLMLAATLLSSQAYASKEKEAASYWTDYYTSYGYEQIGDWANAIKSLSIQYKKNPKNYTLNLRLGYLYFADKKYANAIEHYENAIESAPKAVSPLVGLIRVRNAQGQYTRAVEVGYRIINLDFYNYYGNLNLAYALRMEKKFDLAEKVNLKILALYPEDTQFLQEYALLQQQTGQTEKAHNAFEYLLLLDPENIAANEYMANLKAKEKAKAKDA